jgi:beta-1,4-mannosyl-glycoprotein beta-1,4-N-acetylglucosaminyltransferase
MKVVDCFPFFDEFLILDIRLNELYDVVDKFVIVEAEETFSGIEKPLYLTEVLNKRYSQYADKIEIIRVPKKEFGGAWDREYFQKNHISKQGLSFLNLSDDDLILFADADEIPRASAITDMVNNGYDHNGEGLGGPCFYYKLNVLTSEYSYRPKAMSYKNFTNHTEQRYATHPIRPDAGWHFSYLKTPENIKKKIEAFSHQEFNNDSINNIDNISSSIENVRDLFGRKEVTLSVVDIDDSFPRYIRENKDTLSEWIA